MFSLAHKASEIKLKVRGKITAGSYTQVFTLVHLTIKSAAVSRKRVKPLGLAEHCNAKEDIIIRSLCNLLFLVLVISVLCKLNKLGVSHYYFYNVREIFLHFVERFIRNACVRYRAKG